MPEWLEEDSVLDDLLHAPTTTMRRLLAHIRELREALDDACDDINIGVDYDPDGSYKRDNKERIALLDRQEPPEVK